MLEIASTDSTNGIGVFQKDIALNQDLSNKYLDHIIHSLKTAGLICNAKGKKSGYLLTRKPEDITIFDIHEAFEPDICLVECLSRNYICDRANKCMSQGFWRELNLVIVNYLRSVTLADLVNRQVSGDRINEVIYPGDVANN